MPSPKRDQVVSFPTLAGGLNVWELDYRLAQDESPEMKNLMWRDGVLNCRDGQIWRDDTERGKGYAAYERPFHGFIVAHIGTNIVSFSKTGEAVDIYSGVPEVRGTFFVYGAALYYKTRGAYIKIVQSGSALQANAVAAYTPVILINADPETAGGALYQPENRLSAQKTVWYNAKSGVREYHLPVDNIDSVDEVTIDGVATTAYTVDRDTGVVTFETAPAVTDPPTNNTVVITYSKPNEAAGVLDECIYATTYGGTGELCIILAGSLSQPNAYFWNGNNIVMDAGYFPMQQYQLAGNADNPITGFGKQQAQLVVFSERSVGRTSAGTTTIDGRTYIDMPYTPINDKTGCDLPWTIQLIGNYLVWCNTEQGAHLLLNSTWANENNVVGISRKVNGSETLRAMLYDLRTAEVVSSCDDDRHYWVQANGHVWVWDYTLSEYKDPSWFYWTNVDGQAFITENETVWHVDSKGRLTQFVPIFADYDGPIEKVYRFATQNFGSYDHLKNVNSVVITMRSDTNTSVKLTYLTDYEERDDLTDLKSYTWSLVPRDLSYRSLAGRKFAQVFRRRPMCRRVKHFTMKLYNNNVGEDLSIVSAQLFYNFQGRYR